MPKKPVGVPLKRRSITFRVTIPELHTVRRMAREQKLDVAELMRRLFVAEADRRYGAPAPLPIASDLASAAEPA